MVSFTKPRPWHLTGSGVKFTKTSVSKLFMKILTKQKMFLKGLIWRPLWKHFSHSHSGLVLVTGVKVLLIFVHVSRNEASTARELIFCRTIVLRQLYQKTSGLFLKVITWPWNEDKRKSSNIISIYMKKPDKAVDIVHSPLLRLLVSFVITAE
jgi:hypothetical protein